MWIRKSLQEEFRKEKYWNSEIKFGNESINMSNNWKRGHEFGREKGAVCGKFRREDRGRRNDVILLISKNKR